MSWHEQEELSTRRGIVIASELREALRTDDLASINILWGEYVAAAARNLGECRIEAPYADVRPVMDADGLRWECTHRPPHRSAPVTPIEP